MKNKQIFAYLLRFLMTIKLCLHWLCKNDELHDMPMDLFVLLQAIADNGSLRAAARECDMSYRHAWGMLQVWQQHFAHSLADLKRGRGQGAVLTAVGKKLLWEYQRIAARLEPELESLASELSVELAALINSDSQKSLRIAASHGLVIANLRELAKQSLDLILDIQFHGSLDSLQQYRNGRYDVAGFHLPEGKLGKALLPKVKRLIHPEEDILVYALRRRQGLMTASGNPKNIQSLTDLLRFDLRFINRQRNSGSRITLDEMFYQLGLDSSQIKGYDNEEFTHSAVAALVASGVVDCGFGLEAAAVQFHLEFIPLSWETYWFALPKKYMDKPPYSDLIKLLSSDEFNHSVADLKGYDASRSGTLVVPDKDLSVILL